MSMVPMTPNAMYIEMALDRLKRQEPGTQHEAGKPTPLLQVPLLQEHFEQGCKKELHVAGESVFRLAGIEPPSGRFLEGYIFGLYVAKAMQDGGAVL